MFGIGGFELFLILIFGFLIFGPDKLPVIAKTVAQAMTKFRSAQEEMTKVIKTEVYDPSSDEPFKNPLEMLSKVGEAASKGDKKESFSERKAQYDKERAAKKVTEPNESRIAEEDGVSSHKTSTTDSGGVSHAASAEAEPGKKPTLVTGETVVASGEYSKTIQDASDDVKPIKPKKTAEELYGTKPKKGNLAQLDSAKEVKSVQNADLKESNPSQTTTEREEG